MKPSKITASDILILGLKSCVTALHKADGRILWTTQLMGRLGQTMVIAISDGGSVFAYTSGHLFCLDLGTGRIRWKNDLPGLGYGLASLALADGSATGDLAAQQQFLMRATADAAAASTATQTTTS